MSGYRLLTGADGRALLADAAGRLWDAAARTWWAAADPAPGGADGEAIPPERALRWLQRESGHPLRPPIGVIGPREARPEHLEAARAVGAMLAGCGFVVICGGRQGVMEATCAGVAAADGISVGLLPDEHWDAANPHVTIPIATGIGVARNAVIARAAACLIAIGGGYGTHSEMAFGLQFARPVLALLDAPDIPGAVRVASVASLPGALAAALFGSPAG